MRCPNERPTFIDEWVLQLVMVPLSVQGGDWGQLRKPKSRAV